ncbi:MAG: DUF3987 domain-containing protein [Mediterranea massiliensis]|nr:DUF3987 domain-containing protein [Mediterranea massiliensis]
METLVLQETYVSEFKSVRDKTHRIISIQQFLDLIRSERFKEKVERYRRLKSQGDCAGEADAIKADMPCIIPTGVCRGSHAVKDFEQPSGLLCIDLDHTDGRTSEVLRLAGELPWVLIGFISISGNGVKLLVRVSPRQVQSDYESLYAQVGRAVSKHVGHAYDEKCRILTQPCYYSWHPDAFCNPEAEEFMVQQQFESDVKETSNRLKGEAGVVEAFVAEFERRYPFVRGRRNDIALKLGNEAAYKGFSTDEVQEVCRIFAHHYSNSDFTEKDIVQRVISGYQYAEQKMREETVGRKGQDRVTVSYDPLTEQRDGEDAEEVLEKNDILRGETPCFPDELFERLPEFLKRCIMPAGNRRERDILLLGSLNSCSALFPRVSFFYKNTYYSPHFYLAVVAPAGTGKGVLGFATSLLDSTQCYYEQQVAAQRLRFERETLAWENELSLARKEKRKPQMDLKPTCCKPQYLKLPATTSKSRLIESLAVSGETGCCMTSTEIVTLVSAIRQDYGRFEDILLKCYHHEEVASSYKTDGDPIVARSPRLALCLSGTQEQFATLFQSLETGLYSRFAFYTRERELQWESCCPHSNTSDLPTHFRKLGEELLEMHRYLLESPTVVSFTPTQWEQHTDTFSRLLENSCMEKAESVAGILFRHGLLTMRIASVLTLFRKWDDYRYAKEYICTENDFLTALQIATTLLEHSLLLCTSLPQTKQAPMPMHHFHRTELVMEALNENFSYKEFMQAVGLEGASESTGKRILRKLISMKLVVKEGHAIYKKRLSARSKGHS